MLKYSIKIFILFRQTNVLKELDNLKAMHNNHMLQMPTLINQKTIEEPGAKKAWWQFWK
jgi:hypothetical protein